MSVICSTLFFFRDNLAQAHVAFYCMAAGAAAGWLSTITGLLEALLVPVNRSKAMNAIFLHASLNAAVTIAFTIWAVLAWKVYPDVVKDSSLLLLSKWIAIIILVIGNFTGGKLLLDYHVGISSERKN